LGVEDRPEDHVTTVIKEALEEIKETIIGAARWNGLTSYMRYTSRDYVYDMVDDTWLLDYEAHEAVRWSLNNAFAKFLFNTEMAEATNEGRDYSRTFVERYPLLFDRSGGEDHIKLYIDFCKTLPQPNNDTSDEDED
jgi:hypothetical protein